MRADMENSFVVIKKYVNLPGTLYRLFRKALEEGVVEKEQNKRI